MTSQQQKSRQLLINEWKQIYHSKASKFVLVSNVQGYKYRKQGDKHYVIGTKNKIQRKANTLQQMAKNKKTVFMQLDNKQYLFSNASIKQVLFYINLDQQQIISKSNAAKITQNFFDKQDGQQDQQIQGHAHPILINTLPICPNNCILAMYPDEQLPQIIGQDIVLLLLNLFKIFPEIKIGYNSLGAGCSINNLHFQLFYTEDLIGEKKLPIQLQKRKQWKKSSLCNPKQQINLYTVGIRIQQINTSLCHSLVVTPLDFQYQQSQITTSLSFIFGLIANQLIQLSIPHNVLFTDNGKCIYIMIRQFGNEKDNFGFLQWSGVVGRTFQYEVKEEDVIKIKEKMKVNEELVKILKNNIEKHLSQFQ